VLRIFSDFDSMRDIRYMINIKDTLLEELVILFYSFTFFLSLYIYIYNYI